MSAAQRTAPPMTETEWQEQVITLAYHLGYRTMHVRRSIGKGRRWTTATSVVGWPDLVLWSPTRRRLLFVELKSADGKLTPEQEAVLASLADAGAETAVWRPDDLDAAHALLVQITEAEA